MSNSHMSRTLAVVTMTIAAATSGCTGGDSGTEASGQTLVVNTEFGSATDLDPAHSQTLNRLVNGARLDTLMTFKGPDPEPVPLLATRYQASPDHRRYVFNLRHDARFANGDPLTAQDVVFTYQRALGMGDQGAQVLKGITASAVGEHAVALTSNVPSPAVPVIVASPMLGIMNADLAKAHGATDSSDAAATDTAGAWFSSADSEGVGSGPYVMAEHSTGYQIRLMRNDNYWGPEPAYKEIVIRNVPPETQALTVQRGGSGQVALDLSERDLTALEGNTGIDAVTRLSPESVFFLSNMNPEVSPTSPNQHLQQAIRYAIDYDALLKQAGPKAEQAATVLPAWIPGVLPEDDAAERDLETAKQELEESGIDDPAITLYYVSDGRPYGGVSVESIALTVQRSLQDAGIDVDLRGTSSSTFVERYLAGQLPWAIVPNSPLLADPSATASFLPGGFLGQLAGWEEGANPQLEAMAKQAQLAPGQSRLDMWMDIERKLAEEGPWIPLFNPVKVIVASSDVAGIVVSPDPLVVLNLRSLRPGS